VDTEAEQETSWRTLRGVSFNEKEGEGMNEEERLTQHYFESFKSLYKKVLKKHGLKKVPESFNEMFWASLVRQIEKAMREGDRDFDVTFNTMDKIVTRLLKQSGVEK
jgi:hypothetical protein